ncbi:hypothetical protein ACFP3I_02865 [Chryseobacterium arachidis]|uniref:hypothetical protein n=1 Tax=Chryseobacterium arachidis TaxID=1416778 RepID=UPI003605BBF4
MPVCFGFCQGKTVGLFRAPLRFGAPLRSALSPLARPLLSLTQKAWENKSRQQFLNVECW